MGYNDRNRAGAEVPVALSSFTDLNDSRESQRTLALCVYTTNRHHEHAVAAFEGEMGK